MIKEFNVNTENKTYKDGMFNRKLDESTFVKFKTTNNLLRKPTINNPDIEEGIVYCDFECEAVVYKLPPQELRIEAMDRKDKYYHMWSNECYFIYRNGYWGMVSSDDWRKIPFFFTNMFSAHREYVLGDKNYRYYKICHGHTLDGRDTSFEGILLHIKQYIMAIIQGQPNTDLDTVAQFGTTIRDNRDKLLRYTMVAYKTIAELQKDIKTKQDAVNWYKTYKDLPERIVTAYNEAYPLENICKEVR